MAYVLVSLQNKRYIFSSALKHVLLSAEGAAQAKPGVERSGTPGIIKKTS